MKDWSYKPCVILASGPGLTQEQVEHVRTRFVTCNTIAVNATAVRVPWADVFYAGDYLFWKTFHTGARQMAQRHNAELWTQDAGAAERFGIKRVKGVNRKGLGENCIHTGGNSGYQAINLAYLWKAKKIILLGFTMREIDGKKVFGHMDYGKKDPSLGWRFTDAWLSMAGTADIGTPNGLPIDEWGIRVADDKCTPVGASVARGGATNSPAAVYALTKYVDWMKKYAPKEATGMTFGEAGPVPAQGQIAQQIFWYTAFTADMTKPGLPVVNADGTPKWRMAPGPNGPYWKQGMQNGYQDVGSWTFFANHDPNRTAAAWLYAQFITAKTTSLKKTIVGLTPIRESDIQSKAMTDLAPKLGGLVEFYRSPARVAWSPTGTNVPDYPKLAQLWWKNVAQAVTGEKTPQGAMDTLADEMDQVMARLERAGMAKCAPKLNPKGDPNKWLSDKAAPWKKLANEKPKGETIDYEKLLAAWKAGKVR